MKHIGHRRGGLWCDEVLARLSDFLDGDLGFEDDRQMRAHLSACPECSRFGGEMQELLTQARSLLHSDEGDTEGKENHLLAALEQASRKT